MVKRALIVTIAAEGVTTLAMLLTFRLAAELWGPDGLSEWVLARRVITLVLPAAVLGLDIALTLAISRQNHLDATPSAYLGGALPPIIGSATLIALLMLIFPQTISLVLFGSDEHVSLLAPVAAMIGALAIHVVLFAFLRGTMHFVAGNLLHVGVYGLLPIATMLTLGLQPRGTLLALAGMTAAGVCLFGGRWFSSAVRTNGLTKRSRELLRNGLPRVPAAFGVLALFGIPPIVVAHVDTLMNAAFMSMGMSVVTIAGSAFSPLSVVLLPIAARARATQDSNVLLARFKYLMPSAMLFGVGIVMLLLFAADHMAAALLGQSNSTLSYIFRWVGFSVAPYIYFVCVRPVVDAHASSWTITRWVVAGVVVNLVSFLVCREFLDISALNAALIGHVSSIYVLAIGAFVEFRQVVRNSVATGPR